MNKHLACNVVTYLSCVLTQSFGTKDEHSENYSSVSHIAALYSKNTSPSFPSPHYERHLANHYQKLGKISKFKHLLVETAILSVSSFFILGISLGPALFIEVALNPLSPQFGSRFVFDPICKLSGAAGQLPTQGPANIFSHL